MAPSVGLIRGAPEVRTKCETEKAAGYDARVALVARGKYFRLVAEVLAAGENLSDLLLKRDLARPYAAKNERALPVPPRRLSDCELSPGFTLA